MLAMICDLRVVAPEAYFQFPVAKYGLALDNWSIRRLTSLVGAGRARGMLLAAERLTADVALQTGMANRIGTLADAQAWAAEIAGFAPLALQHAKRVLNDDGAYEDVARAQGHVRQGLGQPGRHRGPGGAHREAAAELPGRLSVVRAALRSGGTATLAAGGWVLRALHGAPAALGAEPGEIEAVARRSPHYRDGAFVNLDPASAYQPRPRRAAACSSGTCSARAASRRPSGPIPLACRRLRSAPPISPCTWFGHSTALIEVDGYRVLADPVWSRRCSPSRTVGPQRMHAVPAQLDALPAVDAVMISHDHYDHLDIDTILGLARTQRARSSCRSVSARTCASGGSPRDASSNWTGTRVTDRRADAGLHAGPALLRSVVDPQHHAVGVVGGHRTAAPRVLRRRHRLHPELRRNRQRSRAVRPHADAGRRLPPGWPDIHMNPEEAVRAHLDVADAGNGCSCRSTGRRSGWRRIRGPSPSNGCCAAADPAGVTVAVPRPGQRVGPDTSGRPTLGGRSSASTRRWRITV